jgi:transcriptional regulator with XRE-family HTH domain
VTAVGRLLRTLRSARGRTIEETCADADIGPVRLRRLERGTADLEYLEGIQLAKALDLCPNCFRRLFEAASEREALAADEARESADESPAPDAVPVVPLS